MPESPALPAFALIFDRGPVAAHRDGWTPAKQRGSVDGQWFYRRDLTQAPLDFATN